MFYLDTSFIGPLFIDEACTSAIEAWMQQNSRNGLYASDWLAVEFSSLLARRVRMRSLKPEDAERIYDYFIGWQADSCTILFPERDDYRFAAAAIRRFETGLRGGDALHLAVAHNTGGLTVMTLDDGMMRAAALLGIPVQTV